MATRPTALIIRTAGTNCDAELCRAFEQAGAAPELVHVRELIAAPKRIESAGLIGFPGGFSHGDDIAAGRVLAVTMRERLWPALSAAARRGVPMIGVCNGFQVLVQLGLLPGPDAGGHWPDQPPTPTLALAENESGRFIDRWVPVEADAASNCVWTRPFLALDAHDDSSTLPIAHGEGRLVGDAALLAGLESTGRIPLRYAGENPNGSMHAAAGVCDASGLILGLMPHPERYLTPQHHPRRLGSGETPGQAMFRCAVEHALGAGV